MSSRLSIILEEEPGGAEGGPERAGAMPRVDLWEMGSMIAARILLSGSSAPKSIRHHERKPMPCLKRMHRKP